jgi:hypothetical protein
MQIGTTGAGTQKKLTRETTRIITCTENYSVQVETFHKCMARTKAWHFDCFCIGGLSLAQVTERDAYHTSRRYLEKRSKLRLRLLDMLCLKSVTYISEKINCFNWLSSKLRIVIGREIPIRHVSRFHAIKRELTDNTPDLIFLEVDAAFEGSLEMCIRQIQNSGLISSVIVLTEFLPFTRQVELMKMGIGGVIHKDDVHVSDIAEVILQSLEAPRQINLQDVPSLHYTLSCPCPPKPDLLMVCSGSGLG